MGLDVSVVVDNKEIKDFRVGAYSTFNEFRRALCLEVTGYLPEKVWDNPDGFNDHPFFGLIMASDCDASFNTEECAKLYKDFSDPDEVGYDFSHFYRYLTEGFKECFRLAAEKGGSIYFC